MKTERRHELKHNSLDTELVKGVDYLKHHAKGILLAILLVVAVISVAVMMVKNRTANVSIPRQRYDSLKAQEVATADGRAKALTGFEELASQTGNTEIAALACVEAADLCATQHASGDIVTGAQKRAKTHYQRVIDEFSDYPSAVGRAHVGLARLAEDAGDFAAAKEHYGLAIALADKTSLLAGQKAEALLKALDELEKPVRLATVRPLPPTPPTTQPSTAPATQPATAPATAPAVTPATAP
ncbi:MAG: hypothetical protein HN350_20025 [Phycisphaerales bacterium]|jgi:hypothetical protein|nr:hypothetical protein [Phycisphaerales bacterium]